MFIKKPATARSVAFRKKILGVGVNDADYQTQPKINGKNEWCPFFSVWRSMIHRCYSSRYHEKSPSYKGCLVHKDWLLFSNFKEWMILQEWEGMALDKDILVYGNKTYSENTCAFVSTRVNNLLNDHRSKRGLLPIGVCKFENKYMAQCSGRDKRYIGLYNTPNEAHIAWAEEKVKVITKVAETQNPKIKIALLKIADIITPIFAQK